MTKKNGEFVLPGDLLGVSEEFIPGYGAYEDGGKVYSSIAGIAKLDFEKKKAFVDPLTDVPPVPKEGDIVLCEVTGIREKIAMVEIIALKKNSQRALAASPMARIYISQTSRRYVTDISREFQTGDLVRAKVANVKRTPIELSTIEENLGVIKAYCSKCKHPLEKKDNKLECPNCGNTEFRKIASDYRKGVF
ncbi:MAG: exosome complex RNA-binding protein Csl4 [Methanomicrobia archaeon]|nr:exosome complex RNA-binding protein Csl4 [Methanomicrobia archaeon]RLF94159.1 MAG: RNA-binding protein [Thermococci archaeon]HEC95799.1 RNA-binding protein [Euryarchaeota archaeon]RLF95800.1 MAG: RNA-binding protein [Thermococci archaeon]RLF98089.1 MAG: RNA-binding protein [Thermococci archaeon]